MEAFQDKNKNLKDRTKRFAIDVVKYVERMSEETFKYTLGKQILRSGTSVAANYRSACRARSNADFLSKMGVCEEESDETMLWLEVIQETKDPDIAETKRL